MIWAANEDLNGVMLDLGAGDVNYTASILDGLRAGVNADPREWNVVGMTWVEEGDVTAYINKDQSASTATTGAYENTNHSIDVGQWDGEIAAVFILNRAVTAEQWKFLVDDVQNNRLFAPSSPYIIRPQYPASTEGDIVYEIPDRYMR